MFTEPETARVQLCGPFVVELAGRRVEDALPGRQGRLLFAFLALSRHQRLSRGVLIDALWGERPPASAGTALNALVSKVRAAVGAEMLRGRAELSLALPEPARVDVETAFVALHTAETAVAVGDGQRAWAPALTAHFVARRGLLPNFDAPWIDAWRHRLDEVNARALECYATACLQVGGTELPGAERAARHLLEVAPLRETAHLLLMRVLEARGNTAEAVAAYERLRRLLRDELGVDPGRAAQDTYARLLD